MSGSPPLEVADIFRTYGPAYRASRAGHLPLRALKAMSAIENCRTAALGGHIYQCDACGERQIAYNSCRNRHCPKCQGAERYRWLEKRRLELLPVGYFHVVFTLPSALGPVALRNQKVLYNLLFRTAAESLLEVAADPKHLGARLGMVSVLHTWGQKLTHHPHLHCIVPGGGLSPEGDRWVECREDFLVQVVVLGQVFRGKYLAGLKAAYDNGELELVGAIEHLADPKRFRALLSPLYAQDWVVFSKPPFSGPERVLKYLARYTHRVAISNSRLVAMEGDTVVLTYKDYRRDGEQRILRLHADEFIRRFLLHILPEGFVRIRYYGLFANRYRAQRLEQCRQLLGHPPPAPEESAPPAAPTCTHCGEGPLRLVGSLAALHGPLPETAGRGPP